MYTQETHGEENDRPQIVDRIFSDRCADAPHDVYADMHAQCPVSRHTTMFGNKEVLLSRYEDVLWALKHPEYYSSKGVVDIGGEFPLIPLSVDPPDHAKYRRLMDPEFAPRRMAQLEDEMRKFVNETIDTFADRGECDFHEEFASPLPSTFFLALTGLPHEDLPQFLKWRDDTIRPDARTMEEEDRIRKEAGRAIEEYFEAALEEKRRNPDDRLFSRLVQGTVDGRPLTRAELLGACHLLLLGGLDTVTATLDCMITYLARHPDRRDALAADPSCIAPRSRGSPAPPDAGDDGAAPRRTGSRDRRHAGQGRRPCHAAHRRGQRRRRRVREPRRRALRPRVEPPPRVRRRCTPLPRLAPRPAGAARRARGVPPAHPALRPRGATTSISRRASGRRISSRSCSAPRSNAGSYCACGQLVRSGR